MNHVKSCKGSTACLKCDNSKLKSMFRGNVPVECKAEFFLKCLRLLARTLSSARVALNANLTNVLYRDNTSMESSAHEYGEKVVQG